MIKSIISCLIVLMLMGLLIYLGSVAYGPGGTPSEGYLSIPGICRAPGSFLQSIAGGISSGPAWLEGPGRLIKAQFQDVSSIFPYRPITSVILESGI
jgi:hypothetical protein